MLTVHHLNNSRSQRVLWLLEELELPYKVVHYTRDPDTNLAPPALEALHPLGKSPLLADDDRIIMESGAIIDYILRRYGNGRLLPAPGSDAHEEYLQWLHYVEGSAMLPLMLRMYTSRLPDQGAELQPRITDELNRHLGYIDGALEGNSWLVDDSFSGADVQMSFVAEVAPLLHTLDPFPNLAAFRNRIHERPAYRRALDQGGAYAFGPAS